MKRLGKIYQRLNLQSLGTSTAIPSRYIRNNEFLEAAEISYYSRGKVKTELP